MVNEQLKEQRYNQSRIYRKLHQLQKISHSVKEVVPATKSFTSEISICTESTQTYAVRSSLVWRSCGHLLACVEPE